MPEAGMILGLIVTIVTMVWIADEATRNTTKMKTFVCFLALVTVFAVGIFNCMTQITLTARITALEAELRDKKAQIVSTKSVEDRCCAH